MSPTSSLSRIAPGRSRHLVYVESAQAIRRRHEARIAADAPPAPDATPELERAYRALQLHWLRTIPGYRAEARQRVAATARAAEQKARRFEIADGLELARPRYVANAGAVRPAIDPRAVQRGLRELLEADA
jgi:hypothetical protein